MRGPNLAVCHWIRRGEGHSCSFKNLIHFLNICNLQASQQQFCWQASSNCWEEKWSKLITKPQSYTRGSLSSLGRPYSIANLNILFLAHSQRPHIFGMEIWFILPRRVFKTKNWTQKATPCIYMGEFCATKETNVSEKEKRRSLSYRVRPSDFLALQLKWQLCIEQKRKMLGYKIHSS